MRIIINTTNLTYGGGIFQGALSFLEEIKKIPQHTYHVFITSDLLNNLDKNLFPENIQFYEFKHSPRSIFFGIQGILRLRELENEIAHDCVFSLSGPTYWSPKALHLMGFARPHYVYPEYFKKVKYTVYERFMFFIKKIFHKYLFKTNANYFVTQTYDVSKRLSNFISISEKKIFTVSNAYHPIYNEPVRNLTILPPKINGEFRLITISGYYKHKNIEIINKIIPYLQLSDIKIKFILTLPEDIFRNKFGLNRDYIINVGPTPIIHCPYLYAKSDALFLPTILECFSASYPEAMKMGKPILTSNLSFAHDICGEAAEYFDPFNAEDIANKIIGLIKNTERQKELIQKGEKRLKYFDTSETRAKKYLDICSMMFNNRI